MNPLPVDPTPTLIPSTKTLVPIEKGKSSGSLKLAPNDTVTSFVELLNVIFLILIPFELFVGIILGVTLLSSEVFLMIVILESPKEYFKLTSFTTAFVNPSITTKDGVEL